MAVTRTIYLASDTDLTIYNDAQKVAKKDGISVSNFILNALNIVINKTKESFNHMDHLIYVGKGQDRKLVQFKGMLLASEVDEVPERVETSYYLTEKNQFVVYKKVLKPNGTLFIGEMAVYSALDDIPNLNVTLHNQIRKMISLDEVEILDI